MKVPKSSITEKILAARRTAYLGGVYFELRIAYISLAAAMEGKLYANEAIADRMRYLEGAEVFDRAFALMADTYSEPLTPSYLSRLREMIAGEAVAPTEMEARLIDYYEAFETPSLAQITSMHVLLGRSESDAAVYMQTALLVLIKECLRHGYVPPMIDAHEHHQYRHTLTILEINSDASLHFIEKAQARTRERAAFFRIEL